MSLISNVIAHIQQYRCSISAKECIHNRYGTDYIGHQNHTALKHPCLFWTHAIEEFDMFKSANPYFDMTDMQNYCINIDIDPNGPWCYILNNQQEITKAYCGIAYCGK